MRTEVGLTNLQLFLVGQPARHGPLPFDLMNGVRRARFRLAEAALWPQVRRPDAQGVISHESALAIYGLSNASPAKVHGTLPTELRIRPAVPKRLAPHYADLTPQQGQ